MIIAISPQKLSLLKEYLAVFSPLEYKRMSLARILLCEFVHLWELMPIQIEAYITKEDLIPIPLSQLQTTLIPDYPEPVFKPGRVYIEGWLTRDLADLPHELSNFLITTNFLIPGEVPTNEVQKIENILLDIFNFTAKHPIFSTPVFKTWITSRIPQIISKVDGVLRQISKIEPSCLALQGYHCLESNQQIIAETARNCRIPTVAYPLPTLMDMSTSGIIRALPVNTYLYTPWGNEFKDWLQQFGVPSERIISVGNPSFDCYPVPSTMSPQEIRQTMGIQNEEYLIYAEQLPWQERIFRMIWESIQDDPSIILAVKLHPNLDYQPHIKNYLSWSDHDPRVKLIPPLPLSLFDLFGGNPLALVTYCSTVGVEAAYYKIPVITPILQPPAPESSYWFDRNGGAIPVNNPQEIKSVIDRLRNDQEFLRQAQQNQSNFLRYVTIPDGKATERFFTLLSKLAQGKNPLLS